MGLLKGNYKLDKSEPQKNDKTSKKRSSTEEFEKRALERLGGSIAFVQKKDTFVWDGSGLKEKEK